MYVCVYIYIHTCTLDCVIEPDRSLKCISAGNKHAYIYMYIYICIYIYIYIHTHVCIYTYIYMYLGLRDRTRQGFQAQFCCQNAWIYIYMYVHIYIYTYVYIYTHTCTLDCVIELGRGFMCDSAAKKQKISSSCVITWDVWFKGSCNKAWHRWFKGSCIAWNRWRSPVPVLSRDLGPFCSVREVI